MAKPVKISDAEWEVMNVLWEKAPRSSHRVVEALGHKEWSPKTVKSLLSRLVKKGAVGFETEANRYLYFPRVARDQTVLEEARSFMQRVFGGDASATVLHFVQNAELSQDEVARLRRLLDERLDDDEPGSEERS